MGFGAAKEYYCCWKKRQPITTETTISKFGYGPKLRNLFSAGIAQTSSGSGWSRIAWKCYDQWGFKG
jgi:hypothetical protein